MTTKFTLHYNPSSQRHAERIARDKARRKEQSLPPERPIDPPTKGCLSLEAANALFDKYFDTRREN